MQTRLGIFFGAPPKNQYIPKSADRATAPESDDKARFTSLLWGTAAGWMGPSFNIVKMSVKGADLSSSRVLQNLQKVAGFGASDGWELRIWCRTLTLRVKGKHGHHGVHEALFDPRADTRYHHGPAEGMDGYSWHLHVGGCSARPVLRDKAWEVLRGVGQLWPAQGACSR